MKIVMNVNRELLPGLLDGWTDCQGVKLKEQDDGSVSLWITSDVIAARDTDERLAAAERAAAALVAT